MCDRDFHYILTILKLEKTIFLSTMNNIIYFRKKNKRKTYLISVTSNNQRANGDFCSDGRFSIV